jgi:hypothetical protein
MRCHTGPLLGRRSNHLGECASGKGNDDENGWPDRRWLGKNEKEIEAEAVAYLVASRAGAVHVVVCAASRLTTVEPVSTGTPLPLLMASHSEASFSHVAWSAGLGAIAAIR